MARFNFRLQSVLNIRTSLEEQQRLEFAAARKRLDEEEERLEALKVRKAEYEEEGRRLRDDSLNVKDIIDNETAIERIKEYIEAQIARVRKAEEDLETERIKLVDAMRERKTYERLREKAFEEFIAEENHKEGVENDEHNSFVYGQRQLNGE